MSGRRLNNRRRLEWERAVKAVVVFLPYCADARNVLAFAAIAISLIDRDVDAGTACVQLQ
jgi:hypothetical protein